MSATAGATAPLWVGAIFAGAVVVGGAIWYGTTRQGDVPQDAAQRAALAPADTQAEDVPQVAGVDKPTATAPMASVDTQTDTAAADPVTADVIKPRLDEVRLEEDGLAIIAGKAAPKADLILRADGVEVGRATADASGAFATVAMLGTSDAPRVLTLSQLDASGAETLSPDELILAPVTVQVAGAGARTTSTETAAQDNPTATGPESVAATPTDAPEQTTAQVPAAETQTITQTAVAVLKSDEDGVSVIQPAIGPEVMSQVALDTIGYSVDGDVQLSGRAQIRADEVRVYLDNRVIAALDVDDSGAWRGALPDVDTGVYTLRIDEVDDSGAVTSRVETPFKREAPDVLASASTRGAPDAPVKAVTVQAGATLWAIARERYGEGTLYLRVFEANKDSIRDPDLIYPGQVFNLPQD